MGSFEILAKNLNRKWFAGRTFVDLRQTFRSIGNNNANNNSNNNG